MNIWTVVGPLVGVLATALWFLVKRRIERKPETEALDRVRRLLEVRKELAAQNLSADDLERFRSELLGVAVELQPQTSTLVTTRGYGPWFLISALMTAYFSIELATFLVRHPEPIHSLQTLVIAFTVCSAFFFLATTVALGVLVVSALVYGPFRMIDFF